MMEWILELSRSPRNKNEQQDKKLSNEFCGKVLKTWFIADSKFVE